MYRHLFEGVPTKPVLVLAPLVIAAVLALYYYNQHKNCSHQASLREQFYIFLKNNINQTIALSEAMPFKWDKAYILVNYKPDRKVRDCPFEWDWTEEYRQTLIESDLLNVIFFTVNDKRAMYIEFSDEQIDMQDMGEDNLLTSETALFKIESKDDLNQQLKLIHASTL